MKKIQIIKYKCCGKVFAACCEPECYTDSEWLKNLKKYVLKGHTVEMAESTTFGKCECVKPEKKKKTNQLTLI